MEEQARPAWRSRDTVRLDERHREHAGRLELRALMAPLAVALAEHVGWIGEADPETGAPVRQGLPPGFGWDPVESFARALDSFFRDATGPRAQRIEDLLGLGSRESVRPQLGALLGPAGGPVALAPFGEFLAAAAHYLARGSAPTPAAWLLELVHSAEHQIADLSRLLVSSSSEAVCRETGRCLGCGGALIDRGRALYCSPRCHDARRQARTRSNARDRARKTGEWPRSTPNSASSKKNRRV